MAIRLKPDGTIEADSVDELLKYQQEQSHRNGMSPKGKVRAHRDTTGAEGLPDNALRLVNFLLPSADGMNTADLAKHLEVEPRGIGGYVTSLTAWGKRQGLTKKQLITRERRANGNGHLVRRIKVADFFRKMIKEGKVPDMKLDT